MTKAFNSTCSLAQVIGKRMYRDILIAPLVIILTVE